MLLSVLLTLDILKVDASVSPLQCSEQADPNFKTFTGFTGGGDRSAVQYFYVTFDKL